MKKSIVTLAIAASLAAPVAAFADATVYGNVHVSINSADNDDVGADNNLQMSSNTSSVGVKGSEDLGDGLKAIYKLEFGVDVMGKPDTTPDSDLNSGTGTLGGRDQLVGLKGGMGTVAFGAMSSNYKQMGGKVDPLYRTPLEGRGFLGTQSSDLHGGRGLNRGRQTNTLQYTSPKFSGIQLVANTTVSGSEDETNGVGIRWASKNMMVYVDWIDGQTGDPANADAPVQNCSATAGCTTESATKVGGKYHTKEMSVGLQYEDAEDRTGVSHLFLSGQYNINKNNAVIVTYGINDVKVDAGDPSEDTTGLALAYNHKLSKMTNVYVGYGSKDSDEANSDVTMFTAGIKKKF